LIDFAQKLEQTCVETVEGGQMTKDLALVMHGDNLEAKHYLSTEDFFSAIERNFNKKFQ